MRHVLTRAGEGMRNERGSRTKGKGKERTHGLLPKVMPSSGMAPMDRNMMARKATPK